MPFKQMYVYETINCAIVILHLKSEALSRTQHEREAEEHKELWEAEVRARTKLGSKV